jgi:hypothetical protein
VTDGAPVALAIVLAAGAAVPLARVGPVPVAQVIVALLFFALAAVISFSVALVVAIAAAVFGAAVAAFTGAVAGAVGVPFGACACRISKSEGGAKDLGEGKKQGEKNFRAQHEEPFLS